MRSSPLWFVVAGVIALGSIVAAVLFALPRMGGVDAGMIRVVVPGSTVITLDRPGAYTIYHEQQSHVDGQFYASESVSGLRLGLAGEPGGAVVQLNEATTGSSYSIGGRRGSSVLTFSVDQPGRYRLTTALASGRSEPKAVLAIDQGMMGRMFGVISGTVAIACVGLAVAGLIVGLTLWQRSRAAAKVAPARGPST